MQKPIILEALEGNALIKGGQKGIHNSLSLFGEAKAISEEKKVEGYN